MRRAVERRAYGRWVSLGGIAAAFLVVASLPLQVAGGRATELTGRPSRAVGSAQHLEAHAARGVRADALPGGAATVLSSGRTFLHGKLPTPAANLGDAGGLNYAVGGAVFNKIWVSAPASTRSSDGLGPLFNARSCAQCHPVGGEGQPYADALAPARLQPGDVVEAGVATVLRLSVPASSDRERGLLAAGRLVAVPEPTYGRQVQPRGIQGVQGEGRVVVRLAGRAVRMAGGDEVTLLAPTWRVAGPGYGPFAPGTMVSARRAPALHGVGLLGAIADKDIEAWADPDDRDGDGIRGRVQRVWSEEGRRVAVGRFGWKAAVPTLRQQVGEALAFDIGIANPAVNRAHGDCTASQRVCRAAADGRSALHAGFEVGPKLFEPLVAFVASIGVPQRMQADDPDVLAGKDLFSSLGCALCHRPSFRTGREGVSGYLAGLEIWPYSDLLLHDMGTGLADGRPEGVASGRQWRTAPLWGQSVRVAAGGRAAYLHDGRADSLEAAVLWHGGEGQRARDAFAALPRQQRRQLIEFLKSL